MKLLKTTTSCLFSSSQGFSSQVCTWWVWLIALSHLVFEIYCKAASEMRLECTCSEKKTSRGKCSNWFLQKWFPMHFFLKSKREPYAGIVQYSNWLCGDFFAYSEGHTIQVIHVLNIWVWFFFFKVYWLLA